VTSGRRAKAQRRQASLVGHPDHMSHSDAPLGQEWDGGISEDIGTQPAWCASEADLQEARRATHDSLIAQMGAQRTGSVRGRQATGEKAVELLDTLDFGSGGPMHAEYDR
jgi:hypothetical protein